MAETKELFVAHSSDRYYVYVHPRNRAVCRSMRADGFVGGADRVCDNSERGKFVRITRSDLENMVSSAHYIGVSVTALDVGEDWEGTRDPDAKAKFEETIKRHYESVSESLRESSDAIDQHIESARMVAEGGPSTEANGV